MSRAARLPLAIALAAALLAFARSFDSSVGLGLALLALLSPLASVPLDPSLERLARMLSRFAVVAAVLAAWALAIAPMLHGERTDDVLRTIGFVLAGCALPLAVGRPRADLAILVCGMGLFGLAGLHRLVEIRPFIALAGVACAAHAMMTTRSAAASVRPAPMGRAALSVAIAALTATALAVGLPQVQRRIERALLSGRVIELRGRSGLSSEDVRIGEIQSLARSERPVLRLYGPRALRLRAQLFVRFDGRVWHAVRETTPVEPKPIEAPVGPRAVDMVARMGGPLRLFPGVDAGALVAGGAEEVIASRIEPIELDEGLLVTPGEALAIRTENEVRVDSNGLLARADRRLPDPYVVVHRRRLGVADFRAPSDQDRALALALPRRIDPRLVELAARLARAEGAPLDAPMLPPLARIERTEDFLRNAARYTLDTPRYRSSDVTAELLFEHRAGYCEHFATALAVLLRLQGIPARYVTGFHLDEADRLGEHYLVRDEHAHAWVEAWVDGRGWVEADGTPRVESVHAPRARPLSTRIAAYFADLRALLRYGRAADVFGRLKWPLAIALSILGLGYVARNEVRRRLAEARNAPRTRAREKLPADLDAVARAVDAAFRRAGHPRPKSRGLLEHAAEVEQKGLDQGRTRALRDAIDLLHRAAFGGEALSPATLTAARDRLK